MHFEMASAKWRPFCLRAWWRHQMETFSALLAICAGNSPVPGIFPTQRPVTRSFDVFFDLRLNKRLSKTSWGWCFETLSRPLWRQCNGRWVNGYIRAREKRLSELSSHSVNYHVCNYHNSKSPWQHQPNQENIILGLSYNSRSLNICEVKLTGVFRI